MGIFTALEGAGTALAGLGSIANTALSFGNQQYMKSMQKEAWAREDNSIQRRVADLKAAGLSPVLAAGQGASSSAPISITAPQIDTTPAQNAGSKMAQAAQVQLSLAQQKAEIDKTSAETAAIKQQQDKTAMEMAFMQSDNPMKLEGTKMELDFRRALNPQSIEQAVLQNKGLGLANANALLDNKLKTIGIDQANQNLILSKIDEQAKNLGLTDMEKTIAAKQIAIDLASNTLQNRRWDTDWYHSRKLPIDFSMSTLGRDINTAAGAMQAYHEFIDKLMKGGK